MPTILLVADRERVIDRVHTALVGSGISIIDHADPGTAAAVAYEEGVDAVLVDMRVGAMGSLAVTRSVRHSAGSAEVIPVTILLDRDADAFIAKRSGARNWIGRDDVPTGLRAALLGTSPSM